MPEQRMATTAVAGERRLLTVMFCDLVGSTALSESLDPEDYAEVVLSYQETGRQIVEQHGGVVAQFVGDGLVIQFGYPTAHEDDAERAAMAALAIVDAVAELTAGLGASLRVELRCRVGIHSGVTVVGRMGAQGRNDMSLFGTTANIAARVQEDGEPGEVSVTGAFLDLLGGAFDVDCEREVTLRGIADPIRVARLRNRSRRLAATPGVVVARHSERQRLSRRWLATSGIWGGDSDAGGGTEESGGGVRRGGGIVVVGVAGVGKSTLVASLRSLVDASSWVEVRCRELSMLTPFAALAQLAELLTDDSSAELAGVARSLSAAVGGATSNGAQSAEQAWRLVIEASRAFGRAIGAHERLLFIEDVHWLDPSSRAAVVAIIEELAGSRSMIVATSRPPCSLGDTEVIEVTRMNDAEIGEIVVGIGEADGVPLADELVELIVGRAAGVPLYAAAMARAAIAGIGVEVPDSLQASLLARLDRHPELTRVAQAASVLGDLVDCRILAALAGLPGGDQDGDRRRDPGSGQAGDTEQGTAATDALVDALIDAEILAERVGGSASFSHALLREAIYQSLLQRDRRRLHLAAAETISADGGRDDERLALVGHHLEQANELIAAASCFAGAARRSARRGAFAEAVALSERGLALIAESTDDPAVTLDLTMTLGNARLATDGYGGSDLVELWRSAERLAVAADDRQEQSSAMNGQSAAALFEGNYPLAIERAERVRSFGEQHADRSALVRGHCSLAIPLLFTGEIAASLHNARQAIELSRDGDDQLLTYGFGTDHRVIAASIGGMAAWLADDDQTDALLAEAVAHGERIESPISLCLALQQAVTVDLLAGRFAAAQVTGDRLEQIAVRFALPFYVELARLARATASACLGGSDAISEATDALGVLMGGSSAMGVTVAVIQFASCQEGCGQTADAGATARFGLSLGRQTGELFLEGELAAIAARCGSGDDWADLLRIAEEAEGRGALGSARRARATHRGLSGIYA